MANDMKEAKSLIEKYKTGTCSADELRVIDKWLLEIHAGEPSDLSAEDFEQIENKVWQGVMGGRKALPNPRVQLWPRVAVAAAAVGAILFGVYFFTNQSGVLKQVQDDVVFNSDIAPGKQGATLILANGKKIRLTNAAKGEVAKEAGVTISKSADGQLIYEIKSSLGTEGKDPSSVVLTNTLSTTNGETYQVRLPDGTMVWLNAASSLSYPSNFGGQAERRVKLVGEAYFAVVHNAKQPFRVESKGADGSGQVVEDIGTEFNISAYADESSVKTTLVEGSARVLSARDDVVLKPSQQAINTSNTLRVQTVDVTAAIDWKNGFFSLDNERLEDVMNKVARWYDVKVDYTDPGLRSESFVGSFSRFENISTVIKTLERTKVLKIELKGKTLHISKKK